VWFCRTCDTSVYARSKHARLCDRCVHVFDHHCKWLNNCIGKFNYRYFVFTISSVTVFCGIVLGTCASLLLEYIQD